MDLFLGFAGYFRRKLCEEPAVAQRVAALLIDERWPWPPAAGYFGLVTKMTGRSRGRRYYGPSGRKALAAGIVDPQYRRVNLQTLDSMNDLLCELDVDTGALIIGDEEMSFDVEGVTRGHYPPDGKSLEAWVEMVHELMVACDVGNAVIAAWPTYRRCVSDISFSGITLDTPRGERPLGVVGDFKRNNDRANRVRHKLGGTYVRHPRWGTYLRRAHLAKVGGLERVRAEVEPAKVVELGDLVFIQLTERPETSLTADAERKRAALEVVLEPILPPPRPQEDDSRG